MLNYRHLRFWCQKVLPLVYDDSLSYYELLCKVVAYLNHLTEDVVKLTEEVAGIEDNILRRIAEELQRMIQDGSLADILESIALDARLVTGKYLEELPKMPSFYTLRNDLAELTAADFYAMYDELVSQYPERITKVTWGNDEGGVPLCYYLFKSDTQLRTILVEGNVSGETSYQRETAYTNNEMIIFSGMHGDEKANMWALFNIFKAIVTGEGGIYRYFRNNVNMLIAPCVNGWGITHDSRLNYNGVNINRNFPYNWDEYTDPNNEKGPSAGSEKATQFCMDILDSYNTKENHNGVVIIDLHDMTGHDEHGNPTSSIDRYFTGYATDPDYRIALTKASMTMLNYYEANYPDLVEAGQRTIRVVNYATTPTLVLYAYNLGFRYTSLQENRTWLYATKYDQATHNCVFNTTALAVLSVGAQFVASPKLYQVEQLANIGMTSDSALIDIIEAMPPKANLTLDVRASMALINDMPIGQFGLVPNGILEIQRTNADLPNAVLTYSAKGQRRNYQWHAIAFESDGQTVLSPWTMEQSGILSRADFSLSGENGQNFDDIVDEVLFRKVDSAILKVETGDTNLRADLPGDSIGVLTIFATYTLENVRGGLCIYATGTKYYLRTIYATEHSYSDWVEVYTQSV